MYYHLTQSHFSLLDMALSCMQGCTVLFGYRCTFVNDVSGEGSALAVLKQSFSLNLLSTSFLCVCYYTLLSV